MTKHQQTGARCLWSGVRWQISEVQSQLQVCEEAVQGRRQAGQSQRDAPPQQGRKQLGKRGMEI